MTEIDRRRGTWAGRLLRGGLLAAAVAAIVALDAGVVPLPYSTPSATPASVGAGMGRASDARQAAQGARAAGIDATLTGMTQAYAAGDEDAFLAGVDPAETEVADRLRQMFRNLRAIGHTDLGLRWDEELSTVPTRQVAAETGPDEPGAVVAGVELTSRVRGFDRRTSAVVLPWTFALRSGGWKVVGDRDAPGTSPLEWYRDAEPWMASKIVVERRKHVLVVGEPAHRRQIDRLATRLESAARAVRGVWDVDTWNGKAVAYAMTDRAFVDFHFGGHEATGESGTEAVFDAKVTMLGATAATAAAEAPERSEPRLVVTPYLLGRDDAESRAVLTHEMTHVAFAHQGGDLVPSWLVEGIAEYTGYRTGGSSVDGVGALARRGLPKQAWPQLARGTWKPVLVADPEKFYSGTGKRVSAAYTTAWLACLYIADEHGEQTLAELYRAAESADPKDSSTGQVETEILRKVLDTDRKGLLKDVTAYAERIRHAFV